MKRIVMLLGLAVLIVTGCLEKEKIVTQRINVYTTLSVNQSDSLLISDVEWTWENNYLSSLDVSGKIKNNGSRILKYIKIYAKSYDASDNLISEDYTYASVTELAPGSETTFALTDYDCDSNPSKVTIGYSYSVDVLVPAQKYILGY